MAIKKSPKETYQGRLINVLVIIVTSNSLFTINCLNLIDVSLYEFLFSCSSQFTKLLNKKKLPIGNWLMKEILFCVCCDITERAFIKTLVVPTVGPLDFFKDEDDGGYLHMMGGGWRQVMV